MEFINQSINQWEVKETILLMNRKDQWIQLCCIGCCPSTINIIHENMI